MKPNKQNPDFLHLGVKLLKWYDSHARELPWRATKDPYKIWISEVVLQQTQVRQGMGHYLRFVERFPDVRTLASAHPDEVLLYWKGLGYYSRALNLHKAAQQIMKDYEGIFPMVYKDVLSLKGVGPYTASAICSMAYGEAVAAVDGNFYRVLSRLFADGYDISGAGAFAYFSALALRLMPVDRAGDFNQAMMDLGAGVCRPKAPLCGECPLSEDCLALGVGRVMDFPVKMRKTKTTDLLLDYYFVFYGESFVVRQRGEDFIWKRLYEFPSRFSSAWRGDFIGVRDVKHQLSHKNLRLSIKSVRMESFEALLAFAESEGLEVVTLKQAEAKSFPKPLENFIEYWAEKKG
ncbi:A/G-specific adenine glycosylase [Bergeyella sp. RCAD1439]|uniref:A/G-specific adenine glycosylase n=1 Tax=Bergeyella anatis TaxID=3113737 RepID=UPI002E19CAF7|nr:A/G-specific adenine glycosylase [Bergeyella sp. RCAD1439]